MKYYDPEIKALSGLYDLLSAVVEGFPDKEFNQYTKKQKERMISNLIMFSDESGPLLSEEVNGIIYPYPELSFVKLRAKLRAAHDRYIELTSARREEWLAFAKYFDPLTEDALIRDIDQRLYFDLFLYMGPNGEASFSPQSTSSFRQTIYMENPVFSDNFDPDIHEFIDPEIDQLDLGHRISFVQNNEMVTVNFSDIRLETLLFNYNLCNTADGSPWSQIWDSLNAMRNKIDVLGMTFLNNKEQALWELGEFGPIQNIHSPGYSVNGDNKADEIFLGFAERAGNNRVADLTRQYSEAQNKVKEKAHQALVKELWKPESEALTQLIMAEIKDAASDYMSEVELYIAHDVLAKTRATVSDILKMKGFAGEYPHFRKMSSLPGLRLLEIQGQPVFAFNEKYMACMVDCFEHSINQNAVIIDFNASTVFLKKDELPLFDSLDGYSGFFHHKHRRARRLTPNFDFRDDDDLAFDLEGITLAAAKTAACEKLTKEERKKNMSVGPGSYGCLYYGGFFMLAGLLFGLLFCPAMFLLAIILGAVGSVFSPEAPTFLEFVKSLLLDFPWWQMFLFCVIGFGLPMTLVTAFAKKRG